MWFTFRLLAAVAVVALSVSAANAAPITTVDGTSGFVTMSNTGGANFTMNFNNGSGLNFTTLHNGVPTGVGAIPSNLATFTLSRAGVAVPGGTLYSFVVPPNSPGKQIVPTVPQGGGLANFNLTSLSAFVPNASQNSMIIQGTDLMTGNTTAFDYSPFFAGGVYTLTFNVGSGNNLNSLIATNGSTINGTASFSQVAAVPEPASLAVFGVLALGGLAVSRRKLLARRSAVASA